MRAQPLTNGLRSMRSGYEHTKILVCNILEHKEDFDKAKLAYIHYRAEDPDAESPSHEHKDAI